MSSKATTRLRAVIVIVVVIAAVAAGAYFATSRGPVGPVGPTAAPVPNPDTLTQELVGQPEYLDPSIDYDIIGFAIIQNVYEPLLNYQGEKIKADELVPWIAQSYDVSPDGLTYTFHLRSGIKFSDGTPLDAQAVWYNYMRDLIIDDPSGPIWFMSQAIRGGANYSKSYNNAGPSAPDGYGDKYTQGELQDLLNAKPVEVIDPMTVAIHLEFPYADWPWVMAYDFGIISPTAFKAHWTAPTDGTPYIDGATAGDYGDAANPWPLTNMVGTGPYMLSSWDKASGTVMLVRNENYWGGPDKRGVAPIKNVIIKDVSDTNTRVLDLKVGTTDIADIPAAGGIIFQFVDKDTWFSQGKLKVVSPDFEAFPQCPPSKPVEGGKCLFPMIDTYYTMMFEKIYEKGKPMAFQPFQDVRIRKAFTLSFNRTAFTHDIMNGFVIPGGQMLPPTVFGYDPSVQPTPFDPQQAKQLLLDAGANPIFPDNAFSPKDPKTVTIAYILGELDKEQMATLLASQVNSYSSETGLYVSVVGMANVQVRTARRAHEMGLNSLHLVMDYPGPDNDLSFIFGRNSNFIRQTSYNNSEVFKLVDEQAKIVDPAERLRMIGQITTITNRDYPVIWQGWGVAYSISRSWLHERANASIASGFQTNNAGFPVRCCYFSEIEKDQNQSPVAIQVSFVGWLQLQLILPAMSVLTTKKFWGT